MKSILSLAALATLFVGILSAPTGELSSLPGIDAAAKGLGAELENLPAGLGNPLGEGLLGPDGESALPRRAVKTEYIVETFHDLLVTVKGHTATINQTVESYSEGDDKSAVGGVVKDELTAIVSAISSVVDALTGLEGVLTFTADEVDLIANAVFDIIHEIVATIVRVLKVLGIKDLLAGIIADLSAIINKLVLVVGNVVVGVLIILNKLVGLWGLVDMVDGLLTGIPLSIASGRIVGV